MLGLDELLERRPAQLSGGQRQRVAMGRAIVRQPQAFLMDEPLSNLDAKLRVGMRASLAQLHQQLGVTTVYVTHDQVEAMTLGQRVAVDARREDPPGRRAAAALRGAEGRLRGRVHRLARDEPRRGRAGRRRRRPRRAPDPARRGQAAARRRRAASSSASGRRRSRTRAFAARDLPTLDVTVTVLEELGSDAHVFFRVDARPAGAGVVEAADEDASLVVEEGALLTARVDPRTGGARRRAPCDRRRPAPAPLLRPGDRREPARPEGGARVRPRARRRVRSSDAWY